MKDIILRNSKSLNKTYIPITFLIGIIGILIISIYNNAFSKGFFTCKKYILNTYLYILLVIVKKIILTTIYFQINHHRNWIIVYNIFYLTVNC